MAQKAETLQQRSPPGILANGVYLILLIIVIDCIGMLVALVLPAIQAAREATRQAQCQSNMKQFGLAENVFHEANSLFPSYVNVTLCDGSACSISKDIDPKLLKALMTIDGGESVESFRNQ